MRPAAPQRDMPRGPPLGETYRANPIACSVMFVVAFTFWISKGWIQTSDLPPLSLAVVVSTPNPLRVALLPQYSEPQHDKLWALLGTIIAGLWYSFWFSGGAAWWSFWS